MKIIISQGSIQDSSADTIIVNLFEGVTKPGGATGAVDSALDGVISNIISNGDLKGKLGEVAVIYPRGEILAKRVLIAGLGKAEDFDLEGVRQAAAFAMKRAVQLEAKQVATIVHGAGIAGLPVSSSAQATVEGSLLANYTYQENREEGIDENGMEQLTIVEFSSEKIEQIEAGVELGRAISEGVFLARDLVNMPPNTATPTRMAKEAKKISNFNNMRIIVGGRKWATKRDMGAFLAVAKGAGEPPKFIILEHNYDRQDLDTIVLVGKGITFDTGGISIKPVSGMGDMKADMGGAAAVLGAMKTIGALDLPLHVVGITPCTENMPDANAYRPSDVIQASNGKTIEIISTDAEGRMVLADGLVYAGRYNPKAVIDLATLTGASVVALGQGMAASLFGNDNLIKDKLVSAGEATSERLWPMPLWEDYNKFLESDVADLKNSGGRVSGVASSAKFLEAFTDYPWAHIDMAGMALKKGGQNALPEGSTGSTSNKAYVPTGGTGFGVRLLSEFLLNWIKEH